MRDLTDDEKAAVQLLGDAFNIHQQLPEAHPADRREFAAAVHAAQNIILARPGTEWFQFSLRHKR
jgi:hypothetical protein